MTHHIDKAFGSGQAVEEKLWPELASRVEYYINSDLVNCKFHGRQKKTFVSFGDTEKAICSFCLERLEETHEQAIVEEESVQVEEESRDLGPGECGFCKREGVSACLACKSSICSDHLSVMCLCPDCEERYLNNYVC